MVLEVKESLSLSFCPYRSVETLSFLLFFLGKIEMKCKCVEIREK